MLLNPAESTVHVGQIFTMTVTIEVGSQPVDAVATYIDFDPDYLVVVNEGGWPLNQIVPGTALATLINTVNDTAGTIDYAAYSGGGTPPTGTFLVATIRFKVKATASGDTWVRFSTTGVRQTDVQYREESVLGRLQAGHVQLPGPTPHGDGYRNRDANTDRDGYIHGNIYNDSDGDAQRNGNAANSDAHGNVHRDDDPPADRYAFRDAHGDTDGHDDANSDDARCAHGYSDGHPAFHSHSHADNACGSVADGHGDAYAGELSDLSAPGGSKLS